MIHGINLPISFSEEPLLVMATKAGHLVGAAHKPPSQYDVKVPLLDASFEHVRTIIGMKVNANAKTHSLVALGDRESISNMSLFNVLILSFSAEPIVALLDDCTDYLLKGGK